MRTREAAPPILSLESIARGVFVERALKARMDVTKKDREDVLVEMAKMHPDCDISVVDALHHVSRCGLLFEKDWPFGEEAPERPLDTLQKFAVHDYREIEGADEITIKHMLKQFTLICEAYVSDAFYKYKRGTIYTEEDNDKVESADEIDLNAMVLVGWGCNAEGKEYYIIMNNWGRDWGDEGFGHIEKELIDAVYYPMILPPPIDP